MKFLLALKIGMTQIFDEKGDEIPVTLVESDGCHVLQLKTKENDGYEAVQIGFFRLKDKKVKKPQKTKPFRHLKEFKASIADYKQGQEIGVSVFEPGDLVAISGKSKGKGFQGGVKRWGFSGRNRSRGVKHEMRTIGSVGKSTPPRVLKGKKMPGRMGFERITVKNLKIVQVNPEEKTLMIKGAVPGRRGSLLEIVKK